MKQKEKDLKEEIITLLEDYESYKQDSKTKVDKLTEQLINFKQKINKLKKDTKVVNINGHVNQINTNHTTNSASKFEY